MGQRVGSGTKLHLRGGSCLLKTARLFEHSMSDQPAIGIIGGTDRLDSNTAKVVGLPAGGRSGRRGGDLDGPGPAAARPRSHRTPGEPGRKCWSLSAPTWIRFRHLVFVLPVQQAFPGILKLFMDTVHPRHFHGKRRSWA